MKVDIMVVGASLIIAIMAGIDHYQQRLLVGELQTQVGYLTDELKQQTKITADANKQLKYHNNKILASEKLPPIRPTIKKSQACKKSKSTESISLQHQILSTYSELNGLNKVDALRKLITLAKLKKNKQINKMLLDALKDKNPKVRKMAVIGIRKLKVTEQLWVLEPLIKDPDVEVRIAVLETFEYLKDSPNETGEIIARFLDDGSERVLLRALKSVATLNYSDSLPQLSQLLTDNKSTDVIATAAFVIRSLGGDNKLTDSVLPRIAVGLDSSLYLERLNALKGISIIGGKASIPYIKAALKDTNKDIREIAQALLGDIDR